MFRSYLVPILPPRASASAEPAQSRAPSLLRAPSYSRLSTAPGARSKAHTSGTCPWSTRWLVSVVASPSAAGQCDPPDIASSLSTPLRPFSPAPEFSHPFPLSDPASALPPWQLPPSRNPSPAGMAAAASAAFPAAPPCYTPTPPEAAHLDSSRPSTLCRRCRTGCGPSGSTPRRPRCKPNPPPPRPHNTRPPPPPLP